MSFCQRVAAEPHAGAALRCRARLRRDPNVGKSLAAGVWVGANLRGDRAAAVRTRPSPPRPPLPTELARHATHAPPDEAALVARLRAGDEAACEQLFLAHHEPLWRFAYGFVRSREVAEEIVQDVFLDLWRDRARCDVRASLRAWLYAAVRNQALKHVRHDMVVARFAERAAASAASAAGGDEAAEVAMGVPAADAHDAVEAHEIDALVARAIAALPERRRTAMTLRWVHELSAPEIARVVGTTPEAVRVLLTRARQELVGLLGYLKK